MWKLDHNSFFSEFFLSSIHWRIDAFELWCRRRLLKIPWNSKEIQLVHPKGKSTLNIHWKDWYWSWSSHTLATWCPELTLWKRLWGWERLRAGGEGGNRGWDDWMISSTQCTWVWTNSGRWWWSGKPGMLQSMGLQSRTWVSDWTTITTSQQ